MRRRLCTHRAQALVELSLVLPMLVGIVAVLFQFGILLLVALNLALLSRDVGRWIAVHPDSTDATVQAYVTSHLPSNLLAASLTFSFASSDPNDWPWSPRCQTLDSNNQCATRASGSAQRIAFVYDAAPHIVLPTSITLPFFQASVPTTLPRYAYYVQIEPR